MHARTIRATLTLAALAAMPLGAQAPSTRMGAPYHNASRAFIDLMIPHHEMAIMMSEHHLTMSKHDGVKAMARKMATAQRQELAELKAARQALFGSDSSPTPMMRAMMPMMGMAPMQDTAAMHTMMAPDHDRIFLEHMIAHHEERIDMSILAEDSRAVARVKQLAKTMGEAQERDVAEMRRILGTLPAAPASGRR